MSVYDIADHPDFRFRTTDIVIRIGNTEDGALPKEDEVGVLAALLGTAASVWVVAAVPHTATRSLQELRHESLTILPPRMAAVAYIRDREPAHLKAAGFVDPGT